MKNIISVVLKLNLILIFLYSTVSFAQTEDIHVPFTNLEDVPRFPNCIEVPNEEAKECFIKEMNNHIRANFNYPEKARKRKIQGRVTVLFVINQEGILKIYDTHTPEGCELLAEEAERIIKLLPRFKPGEQRGEPVSVSYAQPILFKIN